MVTYILFSLTLYIEVLSVGTDKSQGKPQNSRWPGLDSNRAPPEYKSETLPLESVCSVGGWCWRSFTVFLKWEMQGLRSRNLHRQAEACFRCLIV
jgi:hypothetical protein